jgi:TetR/AcrR family transcriptional repressor of bet genes
MPRSVDHATRREQIALAACRVVAERGFSQATLARIALSAGYTTGMLAHYFDSKQAIVLASLRLVLHRIEHRLASLHEGSASERLLEVLSEALPLDAQRRIECTFWAVFWGQVPADRELRRVNAWVHREYQKLFRRCLAAHWQGYAALPGAVREQLLRSVVTFINGITASAVSSPADWPARQQRRALALQLELLQEWAEAQAGTRGARGARAA